MDAEKVAREIHEYVGVWGNVPSEAWIVDCIHRVIEEGHKSADKLIEMQMRQRENAKGT